MSNISKIREELHKHYGEFSSHLEHVYENRIVSILLDGSEKEKGIWLTYNQVILELRHSLKDSLRVKELQYYLTEDGNPNKICLEIMGDLIRESPELERLYYKILNF